MIDLFIALFGGGYLAHKGIQAHSDKKYHEANMQSISNKVHNRFERQQSWTNQVTDRDLEEKIEADIFDESKYEDLMSEIRGVMAELSQNSSYIKDNLAFTPDRVPIVYGKGFTKKQKEDISKSDRMFALRVLLANRGKISMKDTDGIVLTNWNSNIVPTVQRKQWHKDEVEFILWINEKLKQHGIDHKIFTYTWSYPNHKAHLLTKDWGEETYDMIDAKYVWSPYITWGIDEVTE